MILQYLSVSDQLVFLTRRGHETTTCPGWCGKFITACSEREGRDNREPWWLTDWSARDPNGTALMEYNSEVNSALPDASLYEKQDRRGFFYRNIVRRKAPGIADARATWWAMVDDDLVTTATEELTVLFYIVAPKARLITLVQVHFSTDNRAGGLTPALAVWTFPVLDARQKRWATVFQSLLYALIIYLFVVEMTEMLGYDMLYGLPLPHFLRLTREGSASESVRNYWLQMNLWDSIDLCIIALTATSMWYDSRYNAAFDRAINSLNLDERGSQKDLIGFANLIYAQSSMMYFNLFGSTTFMIAGVRFFKYFAVHPRLGEISETIAISATPIGHFALVFVTLLFVFAYVGHFLFAFAMPEEFGTVWDSVQATIKMMNGEISFQALETAYGSSTVYFQSAAYIPVVLFYFGFFVFIIMLSLNIFLGIVLAAYDKVHDKVQDLDADEHNVFTDASFAVGEVWRATAFYARSCYSQGLRSFMRKGSAHYSSPRRGAHPGREHHGKRDTFLALMKMQTQILEELADVKENLRRVEGRMHGEGRKHAEETKQPDTTVVDVDAAAARDALASQGETEAVPAAPSIRDMNGMSVLCY